MNKILCLKGDGIGPELMNCAKQVINHFQKEFKLELIDADFGGYAIDIHKTPYPLKTKELLKDVDAVLLSAIGDPKYDDCEYRPEAALLDIRKDLGLYCNIRPIKSYAQTIHLTSFKEEVLKNVNLTFFRELSSGAYFGTPRELHEDYAIDTFFYSVEEISRIAIKAFEHAQKTKQKITSVDKANVLATSKLWRSTVIKIAKNYPDVILEHRYVDSMAMDLVVNPSQFQIILTENLFGDILSDQAASLAGSLGMLASISSGTSISLYEPGHGSAPDLKDLNVANPIAMLKSVAMMYENSFNQSKIAIALENAIEQTLNDGIFTIDLNKNNYVSTTAFTSAVVERIK